MDIFKRMAQGSAADFNVFKAKKVSVHNTKSQIDQKEMKVSSNEPIKEAVKDESEKKDIDINKVIQFRKAENLNEEASIKLETELENAKSSLLPVFPIVRYLKNKCMADDAFAAIVNDERKTLAKCFGFVESEVKKALNNKNGWLDDNEVYAYAETYYLTDEAVFEEMAKEKAEAEKKRQEAVAKKRKEQEEKRKKAAKERKKKSSQRELAAEKTVDTVLAENDIMPEKEPTSMEPKNLAEVPVMQEQLCLDFS